MRRVFHCRIAFVLSISQCTIASSTHINPHYRSFTVLYPYHTHYTAITDAALSAHLLGKSWGSHADVQDYSTLHCPRQFHPLPK